MKGGLFIFFLILIPVFGFSQTIQPDTAKTSHFIEYHKLNLISNIEKNVSLYDLNFQNRIYSANRITLNSIYKTPGLNLMINDLSIREIRINNELDKYLKFRKSIQLNLDLGVVGKVLGYSKTTTAFILAIIHLLKYKMK